MELGRGIASSSLDIPLGGRSSSARTSLEEKIGVSSNGSNYSQRARAQTFPVGGNSKKLAESDPCVVRPFRFVTSYHATVTIDPGPKIWLKAEPTYILTKIWQPMQA